MLNLNKQPQEALVSNPSDMLAPVTSEDPVWKILIFDQLGQDVISSVLRVNDLRENGVTVHIQLKNDRPPLPDVPAVYFVEPTSENLRRIADDMNKRLYESFYVNFSSAVPRPLLEDFAQMTVANNTAASVEQVFDQYLNFIVSEPNLFSLNRPSTYFTLNSPTSAESIIETTINNIVASLFSVIVTMGKFRVISIRI